MKRAEFFEVLSAQPESLRRTLRAVRVGLDAFQTPAWGNAIKVVVLGMGASSHAAQALTFLAREQGRWCVDVSADEWNTQAPAADWWWLISESGRSVEPLACVQGRSGLLTVITNEPDSPAGKAADQLLTLGDLVDAGVYVSGYTSTLAAMGLLAEAAGVPGIADGLDEVPDAMDAILRTAGDIVDGFAASIVHVPFVDCLGSGASFAAASQTALMFREACRQGSAAYQSGQYLHGPMEGSQAGALVVFGSGRGSQALDAAAKCGLPALAVGGDEPASKIWHVPLPDVGPMGTAIVQAVVGQMLTGRLARLRGHQPGDFQFKFEGTKIPMDTTKE